MLALFLETNGHEVREVTLSALGEVRLLGNKQALPN